MSIKPPLTDSFSAKVVAVGVIHELPKRLIIKLIMYDYLNLERVFSNSL